MALDRHKLVSEITLELDEEQITVPAFSKAFENFSTLVREITKTVVISDPGNAWIVKVYEGSSGIGLSARAGTLTRAETDAVRNEIIGGLKQLESGGRSARFSDRAVEAVAGLG